MGKTAGEALANLHKKIEKAVAWLKVREVDMETIAKIEPELEEDGKWHAWYRILV